MILDVGLIPDPWFKNVHCDCCKCKGRKFIAPGPVLCLLTHESYMQEPVYMYFDPDHALNNHADHDGINQVIFCGGAG